MVVVKQAGNELQPAACKRLKIQDGDWFAAILDVKFHVWGPNF